MLLLHILLSNLWVIPKKIVGVDQNTLESARTLTKTIYIYTIGSLECDHSC